MKYLIIVIITILSVVIIGCSPTKVDNRDYSYEEYCDSIYETNPVYYIDVLCESDEYCTYIEEHGKWWAE